MAVKLSATYSKKIGLPHYSSHSFMASVEIELSDLSKLESECQRLYLLLQHSVDREIQQTGYLPKKESSLKNSRPHSRSENIRQINGSTSHINGSEASASRWSCTDGQRGFILRLINDQQLDKQEVESLSVHMFNQGVRQLNKMQASQLIDELLAKSGRPRQSRWRKQEGQAA